MTTLRQAAQQALEVEADRRRKALAAEMRAALAQQAEPTVPSDRADSHQPPGCDHCNHPLYAATRCRVCGRVTEPKAQEPTPPPEARTEAEKTAYAAGWWDALRKAQQAEPVEPVAWAAVTENGKLYKAASTRESAERKAEQQEAKFGDTWRPLHVVPLYTAPPQRKPLSNHDQHCVDVPGYGLMAVRLVRAIERAHGITDPQVEDRLARHGIPMPGDPK